jgi:pimeloyl-ACP methyl ester carboxylesterase
MTVRVLVLAFAVLVAACAPRTTVPIGLHEHPRAGSDEKRPRALLVLLPGRGDAGEDFARHGFVDAALRSQFDVDVVTVDAHFGYYRKRTLPLRLHEDVLAPNRARYDEIWLLGISMGGIGALLTAQRYPSEVDGVILIAPYLGRKRTLGAIEAAGGLERWQPPKHPSWDEGLWAWIKQKRPTIYLAYGTEDFGARAHALLANELPKDHVFTRAGEHKWTTWTPLFESLLAAQPHTTSSTSAQAGPGEGRGVTHRSSAKRDNRGG